MYGATTLGFLKRGLHSSISSAHLLLPCIPMSCNVSLWTFIFFLVLSRQLAHPIQCPVPTNWVSSVTNVTRLWGTKKSWLDAW